MTIQREHNEWVSYFHKEFKTQQQTKDSVLHNAFLSGYWLAREEIANRKFKSLLELEEILGVLKYDILITDLRAHNESCFCCWAKL